MSGASGEVSFTETDDHASATVQLFHYRSGVPVELR